MTEAVGAVLGFVRDSKSVGLVAVFLVSTAALARTEVNARKISDHDAAIRYMVCTDVASQEGWSPVACRLFLKDRIEDFLPPGMRP